MCTAPLSSPPPFSPLWGSTHFTGRLEWRSCKKATSPIQRKSFHATLRNQGRAHKPMRMLLSAEQEKKKSAWIKPHRSGSQHSSFRSHIRDEKSQPQGIFAISESQRIASRHHMVFKATPDSGGMREVENGARERDRTAGSSSAATPLARCFGAEPTPPNKAADMWSRRHPFR